MSAQTDLSNFEADVRTTGLDLPDSITRVLDHHHRVRDAINELGDIHDADPRPVTEAALTALDAGKDPATDKATRTALARWQLGSNFGIRLDNAAALTAITEIRAQDVELIAALDGAFLGIVDRLRASHQVLAIHGIDVGLRTRLGELANLGGDVVSARLAWTSALAELRPVRRLYETIIGHAPNRLDYGDLSGDLRESVLADPGWWQAREDMASLFWGLLDAPTWEPGIACRDESIERLARLESERPKPSAAEAKEARRATVINLGAIS